MSQRLGGRRRGLGVLVLVGVMAWWGGRGAAAGPIERRADAPKPQPPQESIKQFRLPPGFRIELVASEPQLADPVAIDFDAQGRMFVCEIHGYNLDGYFDVLELNKTGVLDKTVRRIPASAQAKRRAQAGTYGTIKLLEDTDGDGRTDRMSVWADRLPPCYGVLAARGGVIVLCAPDIVYLADRDGDGKAEVRQTLLTGFGAGELWTRINNPRWGLDNWIYCSMGAGSGGTIRGPGLSQPVRLGNTDFRFKPDGSALEPVSGGTVGFGLTMTDWGDRFIVTNSAHALYAVPLPYRYLARNPYYAAPQTVANAASYNRVYPASQPHPWRKERSQQAAWVKFYGAREATANGYFTATCSPLIYRAAAFPPAFRGNHFTCESQQNLVHRCLVQRDGLRWSARRAPGEEHSEFLTSTEGWFRPVNLAVGPDGALYIVDMYREIIEDYSAIPRYLQQQYGLIEGSDRGRIWRVVYEGTGRAATRHGSENRRPNLAAASIQQLVGALSHPNAWWRHTAQRLLVERGDKASVETLPAAVRGGKTPQARLHALYTLDGLDALDPPLVQHALADEHFAVRLHGLRLAERWLDEPALARKVLGMLDDPDCRVRLQLALTLGEMPGQDAATGLAVLARRDGDDPWVRAAILSGVSGSAPELLSRLLALEGDTSKARQLLGPLASIVGARHDPKQIAALLDTVAAQQGNEARRLQAICLDGLANGLARGKPRPRAAGNGHESLRRLLASPSGEVRLLALKVAGAVRAFESPEMQAAFAKAAREALDEGRSIENRRAAIALLSSAPYRLLADTARRLLDARQPLEIQLAAVQALSAADQPDVTSVLLANWKGYTPRVQNAVVDAIFARKNRLAGLLDGLQRGLVEPQSLDAFHRIQLLENPDSAIRRRAASLLAKAAGTKSPELLERYRQALGQTHDLKRGQALFTEHCSKCHRLGDVGYPVGSDLSAARNRADETLLRDVLLPSDQITVGYRSYAVVDVAGRIFTGVLASESATSITLRKEQGVEQTILRRDIESMQASSQSLMPADMDKQLAPRDLANLIAFLRERLGPVPPPVLTLFEDDPSFVAALAEGGGQARLDKSDTFSGSAALAVTPPQRYSSRIPGWRYEIAENPGPGQFRYLRLAWKSRGGAGVMIELAADGAWPPADKPLRRYYSGKNTTRWRATEVSGQVPEQWTVVTRDLWKDFGPFTLTGIAPTAMGGEALFDQIQLLRSLTASLPAQ